MCPLAREHVQAAGLQQCRARARQIMPLTEWEKAQGMRAPKGAKKQFPVCHLCGREFGTASITIHLKACAEKYEREKGKPAPPAPSLLNELTGGDRPITSADWQAYNEAATEVAQRLGREQCRADVGGDRFGGCGLVHAGGDRRCGREEV